MLNRFFLDVLLIAGLLGYLNYLVNVKGVSIFLAPALMITSICAAMHYCGLINIMPLGAYVMVIGGICLGIYYRRSFNFDPLKNNMLPLVFSLGLLLFVIYRTAGQIYPEFDTMSHWGIVVREMFNDNRMPNFSNPIGHQSYPEATACWIYFLQKFIGYSEGKALFAQSLWLIACGIVIFVCNKSRNKLCDLTIMICILLSIARSVDNLLVDVILPYVTIAASATIYEYRLHLRKQVLLALPYFIVIPMIKHSGMFFVLFLAVLAFLVSEVGVKEKLKSLSVYLFTTAVTVYLWTTHIAMVFAHAKYTRHSIGFGYMKGVFKAKSSEDIQMILDSFYQKWLSINTSYEWQFILLFVVIVLSAIILKRYKEKNFSKILGLLLVSFFVYKAGMLGMYLFNMPGDHALRSASYERYQFTFNLLLLYYSLWYLCTYIFNGSVQIYGWWRQLMIFMLPLLLCCCLTSTLGVKALKRPNLSKTIHGVCLTLLKNHEKGINYGAKVLDYNKYPLSFFFVRFSFHNQGCATTFKIDEVAETITKNSKNFDYILITTYDKPIKDYLQKHGYPQDTKLIKLNKGTMSKKA